MLALRRWERRGDTLRVEFVCGGRLLREYRLEHSLLSAIATELSIATREVPAAVQRLRETAERTRKALFQAEEQLLRYEAVEMLAQAERIGGTPVVTQTFEGRELDRLRLLANLIADAGGVALLGLAGDKAQLVFVRARGLSYDMGVLLREAVTLVGGRGGGRPEAAQGGGPDVARLSEAITFARERLVAGAER
jgi:alanyl-tRNA synthetase